MPIIKKQIGKYNVVLSKYGSNYLTMNNIFDLTGNELFLFLKKKKDAPVGNLRNIYHTQSNRGLIIKIARELVFIILWEVLNGKTFYLPQSKKSKIFVSYLDPKIATFKRKRGMFKDLKLYMSDFKIPQLQLYTTENLRKYNMHIYANNEFFEKLVETVNETGKVGGKLPIKLENILPQLYDRFSYIEKSSINLICKTFFRRLRIISEVGCDLTMQDNHTFVRFYNPQSIKKYDEISSYKKEIVLNKLKKDKLKHFPCQSKVLINLQN